MLLIYIQRYTGFYLILCEYVNKYRKILTKEEKKQNIASVVIAKIVYIAK